MPDQERLREHEKIAGRMRYDILACTTHAGSGHPASSLSAVELMAGLLFGSIFRIDAKNPWLRTMTG